MKATFHDVAFRRDVLAWCDRHGWSGRRLAIEAGVGPSALLGWLRGAHGLSLATTVAVLDRCDLRFEDYVRRVA